MYFYIDESGNTGLNLFDKSQPHLYYGVLSSPLNIDNVGLKEIKNIRNKFSVSRLHAHELGVGKLSEIHKELISFIKGYDLKFDLYRLNKSDYIIISFFDQIFDQGINPAVPYSAYWTPLRYPLLFHVANLFHVDNLFDVDLLHKAWSARIEKDQNKSNDLLLDVCNVLLSRVEYLHDKRAKEIISHAIIWVVNNVDDISYNGPKDKKSRLLISPNLISFQSVLFGIIHRSKLHKSNVDKIIVDQQSQFNNTQKWLTQLYQRTDDILRIGPGLPEIDLSGMFQTSIECVSGMDSVGLEITDLFLWLCKRYIENKILSNELRSVTNILLNNALTDEISLTSLSTRWEKWFNELPELSEYSESHLEKIKIMQIEESRKIKELVSDYT